jgi:hypothetical protein
MSASVYLAKSHSWLYEKLLERARFEERTARLAESRRGADVIIYLHPPWPDADAPDKLRTFRRRDFARTCIYSQSDRPLPWAPGMYCSLESSRACIGQTGAFYVSQHHREPRSGFFEDLEAARDRTRDRLWSFMGTLSNHPLRERLSRIQDNDGTVRDTQRFSDVVRWGWGRAYADEGRTAFSEYAALLGRSSFVLCPRGIGASSIRLFEALQVGRCPVIISDDWLPPPFVDWDRCSLQVPEARINELPSILRDHASLSEELGREARAVWERLFSPESQLSTLVRGCLAVNEHVTTGARVVLGLRTFGDSTSLRLVAGPPRRLARSLRPRLR